MMQSMPLVTSAQARGTTTGIRFNLCLLVCLALLLWLHYDTYRAHNKAVEFAYACDDFGYLRQARLFQQNGLIGGLNTANTDENTIYLIGKLQSLAEPSSWAHMVGPHCHNYKSQTDHVIIQYPPLTGLLLSLFAEGAQARLDLALIGVILIGFLALTAINSRGATVPLLATALGAFLFLGLKRYGWSWSIMGSTLLLTFLGYLTVRTSNALIGRWQRVAEFLLGLVLGLSVGFRIANLLLLSGFVAILGVELIRRPCFRTAMAVFAPGWFSITMMDVTMVLNPITSRNLPYDPLKDFAPITLASKNTSLLSVRAQDGPRTVKELVARAKAAPGKLNYGAGIITTRLAGYLFNREAGIEAQYIPFNGSAPTVQGLLTGAVDYIFDGAATSLPLIQDGQLRALAKLNSRPLPALPDVRPLAVEAGIAALDDISTWIGLVAPAGTPPEIIDKIGRTVVQIYADPQIADRLEKSGISTATSTPAEFEAFVRKETVRWGQVFKDSGIELN